MSMILLSCIVLMLLATIPAYGSTDIHGGAKVKLEKSDTIQGYRENGVNNYVAEGSIQAAVENANSGDKIRLLPKTYYEHDILIDKSVRLQGAGIDSTIVDPLRSGRAFDIISGIDVTIRGMTIQNGYADYGAGIRNEGTLTMQNCLVQNNEARYSVGYGGYGAGIANGLYASAIIKDSTIRNNRAIDGAALSNSGNSDSRGVLTLDNSLIYGNNAEMGGGAIHNNGGIININSGRIFNNRAPWGGAIRTQGDGVININGGSIDNNRATAGGAIFNWGVGTINLRGGSISNNLANHGGGIYNTDGGEVNLYGGSITGNTVNVLGGGIFNYCTQGHLPSTINGDLSLVYSNMRTSGEEDNIYEEYQ